MNITFLIGNGFDLNLGLATTFSAFLEGYSRVAALDNAEIVYFNHASNVSEKELTLV